MLSALLTLALALPPGDPVPVRVDLRVELLTLVWRLIGAGEFNQQQSNSPYARAMEEWFGPAREHEVCTLAKVLRATRGIGYNAVPDLALHLTPLPELALRVPLEPWPERLDKRWQGPNVEAFLVALRSFAAETGFLEFVAEHAELYRAAEASLGKQVEESRVLEWMQEFFGLEAGTSYVAIPGLLCGPANYGVSVRLADGTLELWPVLGCARWDAAGNPAYDSAIVPTVVHEFTHAFANPVVDAHWPAFEPALERLYVPVKNQMASQAYSTPRIYAYESLVRACVTRHALRHGGEEALRKQVDYEASRGFGYTAGLSALLARYEAERATYPDLKAFGPELARFFAARAEELPAPEPAGAAKDGR
ncbi:MAG TPA: DUF4932 domain-containing protein [Planctomycetota bacterium]